LHKSGYQLTTIEDLRPAANATAKTSESRAQKLKAQTKTHAQMQSAVQQSAGSHFPVSPSYQHSASRSPVPTSPDRQLATPALLARPVRWSASYHAALARCAAFRQR